ncbi:MAG: hypothetical protein U0900_07525 [Myxococcota bacterium]
MLPSSAAPAAFDAATIQEDASARPAASGWRTASLASGIGARADAAIVDETSPPPASRAAANGEATQNGVSASARVDGRMNGIESPIAASPSEETASLDRTTASAQPEAEEAAGRLSAAERGAALPGDRGPREAAGSPRPSFWRRIALGRRSQALRAAQQEGETMTASAATVPGTQDRGSELRTTPVVQRLVSNRDDAALAGRAHPRAVTTEAVERRIVEPLLQALVSVEAKLERSHVDLVGRSDQVEQRLTQLWDIEEQLGALGELQESVLHVTEQQRRLEAALVAQTRILRWLVGGIILSLAAAAFSVAFFLRVAR